MHVTPHLRRIATWSLVPLALVAAATLALAAWNADAADESSGSNLVPITPVRVLDTRSDVGLPGPFVSAVAQRLTITGNVATTGGPATVVPVGAVGVVLNATVLGSTSGGFLSIRPGTATGEPATSNVNFTAGQTLANSVTVALPTTGTNAGQIDIFFRGDGPADQTELLLDVVGYLASAPSETKVVGGAGTSVTFQDGETKTVVVVTIDAPSDGSVVLSSSAGVSDMVAGGKIFCTAGTGTTIAPPTLVWESAGTDGSIGQLSGTRVLPVTKGINTFRLVCQSVASPGGTTSSVTDPTLTVVFAGN